MANEIKLTIKVDDNGSLQIVAKNAEKAAKATEKVAKATKQAGEEVGKHNVRRNKFNMMEKGAAQLTNNSTRAFAKQAKTLGGTLVPAYATLAANIFALTAALGALQRAAALKQLEQGLQAVGAASGRNLPYLSDELRKITGYAISTKEAMGAVALGTSAGFSAKQLKDLTTVAKGASLALGRNMEDAMNRLVRGTAKIEPEILDELGIMVRLDRAAENYAAQMGKTATQLTEFERRQAFLNATIDQGLLKFKQIAEEVDPNPYDKLAATFNDLTKAFFGVINVGLGPFVSLLNDNILALTGTLTIFGATIVSKIVPGLNEMANSALKNASILAEEAVEAAALAQSEYQKLSKGLVLPDVAPPSIVKNFEKVTKATTDFKQELKVLRGSETRRINEITKHEAALAANRKIWSKQQIADAKEELALKRTEAAEITALRIKYEQLSVAKKTSSTAGWEADFLSARSAQSAIQAKFLDRISASTGFGGFREAFRGAREHYIQFTGDIQKEMPKIKKASLAWGGLSKSIGLFGNAILKAIPIIGLMTLAFSLLKPVIGAIWKDTNLDKAAKEIIDSLDSIGAAAIRLRRVLLTTKDSLAQTDAILKTMGGIIATTKDSFNTIMDAFDKDVQEEISKIVEKMADPARSLEKEIFSNLPPIGAVDIPLGIDVVVDQEQIDNYRKNLENDLSRALDAAEIVSEPLLKSLRRVGAELGIGFRALPKEAGPFVRKLEADMDKMLKKAESLKGSEGVSELRREFVKLAEDAQKAIAAIEGAASGDSELQKQLVKLGTKRTTPIDNFVDTFNGRVNEFLAAAQAGQEAIDLFLQKSTTLNTLFEAKKEEMVSSYWKQLKEFVKSPSAQLGVELFFEFPSDEKVILALQEDFKQIQQTLIEYAGAAARVKVEMAGIAGLSRTNASAAIEEVALQKQLVALKEAQLQASLDIAKLAGDTEAIDAVTESLEAVRAEMKRIELLEPFKVRAAEINGLKEVLNIVQNIASLEASIAKNRIASQRSLGTAIAANVGIDLAPTEQLDLAKQTYSAVIDEANKAHKNNIANIINEKDAKINAEREKLAKAKDNGEIETAQYENNIRLIEKETRVRIEAAEAQKNMTLAQNEETLALARRAALEYEINVIAGSREAAAARLTTLGLEQLAAVEEIAAANIKLNRQQKIADQARAKYGSEALQTQLEENKALEARTALLVKQLSLVAAIYGKRREVLDLEQAISQEALSARQAQLDVAAMSEKLEANIRGRTWNVEDDLKAFKKYADLRNRQIEEEIKLRRAIIAEEYYATVTQLAMKAGAASAAEQKGIINLINLQNTLFRLRMQSLDSQQAALKTTEAEKQIELERQRLNEAISIQLERQAIQVDNLSTIGATIAAAELTRFSTMIELALAQNELAQNVKDTIGYEQAVNNVLKLEVQLKRNALDLQKEITAARESELEIIQEANAAITARLRNERAVSNLLAGRGTGLSEAQEYEFAIRAAREALQMQILENDIALAELNIRKQIAALAALTAKIEMEAAIGRLKVLNAEAQKVGMSPVISESSIRDLENGMTTNLALQEDMNNQVDQQIARERQILDYKKQQAEQALIALQLEGAGGFAQQSLAERFNLPDTGEFIDAVSAAGLTFKNLIEASAQILLSLPENIEKKAQFDNLGIIASAYETKLQELNTSGGDVEQIAILETALESVRNKQQDVINSIPGMTQAYVTGFTQMTAQAITPFLNQLRELGPDGVVVAAIAEGSLVISDAFATIAEAGGDIVDKLKGVGNIISAIGAIQQASSDARVAALDREIEAEKRRDGKSAESKAKIRALEKKAEAQKRKAFEQDKRMKSASTVINTAAAIMQIWGDPSAGNVWTKIALSAVVAALGAYQLAVINSATFDGGTASAAGGPAAISVGERQNKVDVAQSRSPSGELAYMRGAQGYGETGATNYMPTGAFTGHRATGGNTSFLVGEQGPELFIPERPGTILPADDTAKVSPTANFTFNINTIDTQGMEEALTKQRGNLIRMFRDAANANGEYFLESVNIYD